MNVKRFTARNSRDALMLVRQAFGDDAVVVSTRPCDEGIEVLAMAPDSLQHLERVAAPAAGRRAEAAPAPAAGGDATSVEQDVQRLGMSTLSFQDYVRERMLRRRRAEMQVPAAALDAAPSRSEPAARASVPATAAATARTIGERPAPTAVPMADESTLPASTVPGAMRPSAPRAPAVPAAIAPMLAAAEAAIAGSPRLDTQEMMSELRSMRGLIEQRFGALAFMEKLQRQPRQAQLAQRLLEAGFSPSLVRKLVDALPSDADAPDWAAGVLEHNLLTGEAEAALEDQGGVYALVGATGVGKTTSTAKLAAAFAARHGASQLGLVTLDAYRIGAHEQLRAYGRILGVPVHTAHDRSSLEDLLDLLSAKKMVLIDTAGMAQRDERTRELLEMVSHASVRRLLVVNASAQGETIDDVLNAYRSARCHGVVLSKIDEAVKLAPALDALIRHRQKVVAVANGQRVPEDWHRLSAQALVQRALRVSATPAWRMESDDVGLVFAGMGERAERAAMAGARV